MSFVAQAPILFALRFPAIGNDISIEQVQTTLVIADQFQPPSAAHWLGTDVYGRDMVSRLMVGASNAVVVGVVAVVIGLAIGVPLGLAAALAGHWVEDAIMRMADFTFWPGTDVMKPR